VDRSTTIDPPTPAPTSAPVPAAPTASPALIPLPPGPPPAAAPRSQSQKVTTYKERPYTIQPNDSYATVSRAFYSTPDHAQALLLWNTDPDRNASDSVRAGKLVPGDKLSIPLLKDLEAWYRDRVSGLRPPPGGTQQMAFASPAATPQATAIPTTIQRVYRVRGNNETLYSIADRTLKNGERWGEIRTLNPALPFDKPLPVETEVRLPADAIVRE
jgi:hypothetical protein